VTEEAASTLAQIDADGAVQEALGRTHGVTRARFLNTLALGSAALLAELAAPERTSAAAPSDRDILNFALVLEYLQASFYTEAERRRLLKGKLAVIPPRLGAVERAHVTALRRALGTAAVKRPFFDFGGTTEQPTPFLKTAVALEDLAVAAYKGQAGNIRSPGYLAAAISIHSVEARHAAWVRYLLGRTPAAHAFDKPVSAAKAQRLVASTHFIVSKAKTTGSKPPKYTG
jgi:ferritin-like protein